MNAWEFLYIILLLFSFIEIFGSGLNFSSKKKCYNIAIILLILFAGFRWETGTDWDSYLYYYESNSSINDYIYYGEDFEFGFRIYNAILKSLFPYGSFTVYLLITSIVIFICQSIFIKKFISPQYLLFGLFLFYCFMVDDVCFVRQNFGRALGLMSLVYALDKKKNKSFLFAVLASFIHVSNIFFLFSYLLINWHISNKWIVVAIVCSILLGEVDVLTMVLEQLIGGIGIDMLERKAEGYSGLSGNHEALGVVDVQSMYYMSLLKKLIFIPIFLWLRHKIATTSYSRQYNGILNVVVLGYCIYFVTHSNAFIARMSANYSVLEYVLFAYLFVYFFMRYVRLKLVFVLVVAVYGYMKMDGNLSRFPDAFRPYYFIWEQPVRRTII